MEPEPPANNAATSGGPRVVGPGDGKMVDLRSLVVRFMVWNQESGGGFSLVEHPIPPRTLAAPLHRHSGEDEYSYVLEGRMGGLLGDAVVHAGAGTVVFKPRHQWHTFWNAGDVPCRILEIICPGGFKHLFEKAAEPRETTSDETPLDVRYGIEFDLESVGPLCEEHGLVFPDA